MLGPFEDFATRYYWTRVMPLKCCGCFNNHHGSGVACLIWAGFSFYFAVLSFMNRSPFFSYLHEVPLIVFGVVNLIFGVVSVAGFIVVEVMPSFPRVRSMVHAIGVTAAIVLIDVLVNFIIFIVNPGAFRNWCINDVRTSVQHAVGNGTTVASDQDYYNCDRLFNDQVKWSLICVFAMYIIYIHWMLVFASFAGTSFIIVPPHVAPPPAPVNAVPPPAPAPAAEMANMPPSGKNIIEFSNLRPQRSKSNIKDIQLLSMLGVELSEDGRVVHLSPPPSDMEKGYGKYAS